MGLRNQVKIKRSPSHKRNLHKRVYKYFRLHMPIPSKFYEALKPYLREQFQADLKDEESKMTLTYTHFKRTEKKQSQL